VFSVSLSQCTDSRGCHKANFEWHLFRACDGSRYPALRSWIWDQDVGRSVTDFDGNIIVGGTLNKLDGNGENFAIVEYLS
jgi:hypothetical protein